MTFFSIPLLLCLSLAYLAACRFFRFRCLKALLHTYKHDPQNYRQAQSIVLLSATFDMPFTFTQAMSFALFKTYGIRTIGRLLNQTGQLAQPYTAGRRAEDTTTLLAECMFHELDTERARMAVARINYLHGLYANKISNDDLLYTLSLFICEPIRWSHKYEWRSLVPVEEQAYFLYWKEMGERMGIKNIPSTLTEIEQWANNYEVDHMIYSKESQACGEATLKLMLSKSPRFMRSFLRRVMISLLDERLRLSMGLEEVPEWIKWLTTTLLKIRAFFLLHCALPRIFPGDAGQGPKSCPMNEHGRYRRADYLFEPWYVKETWWGNVFTLPNKRPGVRFKCQGFKVEELGPEKLEGKGVEIMQEDAKKMQQRALIASA